MKIFISADIEGTAGVTHWDEAIGHKPGYEDSRELMTREVLAACEGALESGAQKVTIKDAHSSGRNIKPSLLMRNVELIRGWSGHPFSMVQGLDNTFDAALFTGYHSPAGSAGGPLSHTFSGLYSQIKLNGHLASEFLFNTLAAASVNVPVVFISGDEGICNEAKGVNEHIVTQPVTRGIGASTTSLAPIEACEKIKWGVLKALKGDLTASQIELPEYFIVEMTFHHPADAYRASFYPEMKKEGAHRLIFETEEFFNVLSMLKFMK